MTEGLFHNMSDAGGSQFIATALGGGRGGRNKLRPSRLVHTARRGVTLVELLISMLILTIVCLSWLEIIGIQSARKEARRREAVERLSGMMDAFLYQHKQSATQGGYRMVFDKATQPLSFVENSDKVIYPIFTGDVSPIGYDLSVVQKSKLPNAARFGNNWGSGKWLIGRLYNTSNCATDEAGKPFFTLPVCLGL